MTVGFRSVTDPQADSVDRELEAGVCMRGRDRLRAARVAEMVCQATPSSFTQRHTMAVTNAQCLAQARSSGVAGLLISPVNAQGICEADQAAFQSDLFTQEIAEATLGCRADPVVVINTPDLTVVPGTVGTTAGLPQLLVGAFLSMANATQGYTVPLIPGFANRSQRAANAVMDYAGSAVRLTKRVLTGNPQQGHTGDTVSLQRLYSMAAANAVMGHIAAPPSGVAGFAITPVAAITGRTATPVVLTQRSSVKSVFGTLGHTVVAPTMTALTSAAYYGTGISTTDFSDLQIGNAGSHPNAVTHAIRFKAKRTSTITSARVGADTGSGLSLGSGVYEARILNDDGSSSHLPVDSQRTGVSAGVTTVSHTGSIAHLGAASNPATLDAANRRIDFTWASGAPPVVRNNTYHLEIRNIANDPNNNFGSMRTLFMTPSQVPLQPTFADADIGITTRTASGSWSAAVAHTPIWSVGYADGRAQGQGYNQPVSSMPSITGPLLKVRQLFTPGENLSIAGVSFRGVRWVGAQQLHAVIRRESNNSVISLVSSCTLPLVTNQSNSRPEHRWTTLLLGSAATVSAGVTAALEFTCTAGGEYRMYALDPQTAFPVSSTFFQGRAQFTSDGGTNWQSWPDDSFSDLQFYFTLA
jgi:hypothetical protein